MFIGIRVHNAVSPDTVVPYRPSKKEIYIGYGYVRSACSFTAVLEHEERNFLNKTRIFFQTYHHITWCKCRSYIETSSCHHDGIIGSSKIKVIKVEWP